jgi:HEAT repeat protein
MGDVRRLVGAAVALCAAAGPAPGYIDRPPTLGRLVQYDATHVAVLRVEAVSKDKRLVVYRKVADLKGKYPAERVRQRVARRIADPPHPEENPRPRDAKSVLDAARPGEVAVFFHDAERKFCATCVGGAWYVGWAGADGWWGVNEFEERGLAWAYAGPAGKLRDHVRAMLAGKEVVVTAARYDPSGGGARELWDNQTAYRNLARERRPRLWRVRASLKIISYDDDPARFVVGPGTGDRGAVPGMLKRLRSKDAGARRRAAEDLGEVGPEAKAALPALTAALKDEDGRVRVEAAEALWRVGGKADPAVGALAEALKGPDAGVRELAAEVLWEMGAGAKGAAGALARALKDKDVRVRRDAAEALWRIGPGAGPAVKALTGALKDEDAAVRRGAAGALGALGPAAKPAVEALRRALKDKDLSTRHFAARALVRVGDRGAKAEAAPVLREVLRGMPDQRVRAEVIVFLWMIGPEPASTFPGLKTGDSGDVQAATQLLRKVDRQTRKNAVPTLVAALEGARDPNHRAELAQVLGRIGPDASAAVPALTAAAKDKEKVVRDAATEALRQVRR